MLQVGCASASSGGHVRELVARAAAERAAGARSARASRPCSAVASLEALEARPSARCRPGSSSASAPLLRRERELAGGDEALLVRERERRRRARAPRASPARPAKPTTAFRTTSGSARSSSSVRSPPTCVSGARPSIGCEPDAAATSSSSGLRADDLERLAADRARWRRGGRSASSACDSATTAYVARGLRRARGSRRRPRRRRRGARRCRSSTPPWPPSRRPVSLTLEVALERRLEQVAERRRDRDHDAEHERLADRQEVAAS